MRLWLVVVIAGCGRVGFDERTTTTDPPRLFAGQDHACLLRDGELFCWGGNDELQLGLGAGIVDDQPTPQRVPGTQRWIDVALGEDMSCALDDTGLVWCWGSGVEGRLGLGVANSPTATAPTPHLEATRYRSIHGGREHTCAIGDATDAGTLWCWGRNGAMQLGNGTTAVTGIPTQVAFLPPDPLRDARWARVGAGSDHTCATQTDDTLWCWGSEGSGQLGQGGPAVRDHPNLVDNTRSWVDVDSGFDASCATTNNGDVFCWGRNNNGQLGVGDVSNRDVPTRGNAPIDVVELEFAYESICVRTSDNKIACSGQNDDGELGRGDATVRETTFGPAQGEWTQLVAGDDFVCGLDLAGTAQCWGVDARGQLGNGGATGDPDALDPVPVLLP